VKGVEGSVNGSTSAPVVPHERFVVPDHLQGVLQLPAIATVVLETSQVPAEVGSLLEETVAAESILQIRVNLHLLGELQRLDLDEGGCHRLHIALGVAEGHSS